MRLIFKFLIFFEEAMALQRQFKFIEIAMKGDFEHKSTRRKFRHDYRAPWKYHITIAKAPGCENFSSLDAKALTIDGVSTKLSPLGQIIWHGIRDFQQFGIKVYQYAIMPDHLHLLLHATGRLPEHLGYYIARFKTIAANEWRRQTGRQSLEIFLEGYHDRIILPEHNLNDVYQYIRQNPYRLAVRKERPDFFRKQRHIFINGREVQAYGNLFLLRNPFKYALVVHRTDDATTFNQKLEDCLYHAANGGVVVSAFISPREKEIKEKIEEIGGKNIIVHDRPFGEREKPSKRNFDLCSQGRLLLISPIGYLSGPKSEHPSRAKCLDMNSLAQTIAQVKGCV